MKQDLHNQIREELQTWKAPADLVARTKEAVSREEAKAFGHERRKLRHFFKGAAVVVAAAIFVVILPLAFKQPSEETKTEQSGTWLRLGTADDREIYLEEEVSVERVKVLPMDFRQAESEDAVGGVTVQYVRGGNGIWMAAFEDQGDYVVVTARVEDELEMREIMETLLSPTE